MYIKSVKYGYRLWLSFLMLTLANAMLAFRENIFFGLGALILWVSFLTPMLVIACFIPFVMMAAEPRAKLKKTESSLRALCGSLLFYIQVKSNVTKMQNLIVRIWHTICQAVVTAWQWIVNKVTGAYHWVVNKFKRSK